MDEFWNKNLKDFLNFLMIIILIMGFIGNIMCFKVFSSPTLKKHPISIFFRFIAIFDQIMIVNGVFYFILLKFGFSLSRTTDFFCKFKEYLVYTNGAISTWLMVVVSLDRFICIRFPKRFSFCYKLKFQLLVVFIVVAYNYIFYSFMTWNSVLIAGKPLIFCDSSISIAQIIFVCFKKVNNTGDVELSCKQSFNSSLLEWMDLFNSTLVPFTAIFILSITLIYYVRLSRTRVHGPANPNGGANNSRSKRDNRLAVSVISINFLFFILNLPVVIYDLIVVNNQSTDLIDYTMQLFYYAYFSVNFYAQICVNTEFRNELLRLLNLKVINLSASEAASTVNSVIN